MSNVDLVETTDGRGRVVGLSFIRHSSVQILFEIPTTFSENKCCKELLCIQYSLCW